MNRLAEYRIRAGLLQSKLAMKTHMRAPDISKVETGVRLPWAHEAAAIANVFGVRVSAIFPEGVKTRDGRADNGRKNAAEAEASAPPPPPVFVRRYPAGPFLVMCAKCRTLFWVTQADDAHPLPDDDEATCPACAMPVRDIMPREGARV